MYWQTIINKRDRNCQLIFSELKINEKISVCQLFTVTYGTIPFSYLMVACLNRLPNYKENQSLKQLFK